MLDILWTVLGALACFILIHYVILLIGAIKHRKKRKIRRAIEAEQRSGRPATGDEVGLLAKLVERVIRGGGDSDRHLMTFFTLAIALKAKTIVELGTRYGDSTLPLLLAANMTEGQVTSVDLDVTPFTPPHGTMAERWRFVQQDALAFLRDWDPRQKMDLVLVDDWHAADHVKQELDLLADRVTPATVILLHDTMYDRAQPDYRSDTGLTEGEWAGGGPYRAIADLDPKVWEWATIPVNNGMTLLRKRGNVIAS